MWKTPRTLIVSGAALVVGLGAGAAVVPALAAQDPVLTPEQQSTLQQQSDAYQACLEQQGVTLPAKPADGSRPERPQITDEQKAALRAAHEACEGQRPSRPELSDEQKAQLQAQMEQFRACLEAQGVTRPERPAPSADGTPPQRPQIGERQITDEQRAQMEAARTACADLQPNLGVAGIGPFGGRGPGGPGGPGHGFGGRGGPIGQAPGGTGSSGQTVT
jgi:hypothetical protein